VPESVCLNASLYRCRDAEAAAVARQPLPCQRIDDLTVAAVIDRSFLSSIYSAFGNVNNNELNEKKFDFCQFL